jgi:hypothetical protein
MTTRWRSGSKTMFATEINNNFTAVKRANCSQLPQ